MNAPAYLLTPQAALLAREAMSDTSSRSLVELAKEELDRICEEAVECNPYRDEPIQMQSGAVGKYGYLRLGFRKEPEGHSRLYDIDRRVPFLAQRGLYWDQGLPGMPCIFIISTTGCVIQGDRMYLEINVEPDAMGHVTTQSATKVHMMEANYAAQYQKITVEQGGYLEFMPDPLILHRDTRFLSETRIEISERASMIYSEILLPGRKYHHEKELFGFDLFSSRITAIRQESGAKIFAEKFVLEPKVAGVLGTGVNNGFEVFGNVVLLTQPDNALKVRDAVGADVDFANRIAFGASVLPGENGLVFKVLGDTSESVRAKVREFWGTARKVITGASLPVEFLWR